MKISTAVSEIEREGVGAEAAFTIEFNDKMAKILSKGIYQNVIRAPIRELVCNAWDSHRAAGKLDVPVQVHLPNNLEPYFEVRDFGVGLSDSAVTRLYTRYGASDKSHNNDAIGGFGLGSKAPFAYTSTFTVSSVHDGVRRVYAMYMNGAGLPSVSKMGEEPTTDCNGVTVNVPVKPGDFEAFRENAQETFRWFEVKPQVVGNSRYNLPEMKFVEGFEGRNWRLQSNHRDSYSYRSSGAVAVMANVAYPIRADNINEQFRRLLAYPLVIAFENGELEPAVSREDLNYDPATVQVLETRLAAIMRDLSRKLEAHISKCTTMWQARVAMVNLNQDRSTADILRTLVNSGFKPMWNGEAVDSDSFWYWSSTKEFNKDNPAPLVSLVSETYRARSTTEVHVTDRTVFVLKDTSDASARCRKAYYDNNSNRSRVYLIEGPEKDGWDATKSAQVAKWLKLLGNPSTILSSSLPKPEKKVMKFKGIRWTGQATWHRAPKSRNWGIETELTTAQGGFYVTIEGLTAWKKDVGELDMDTIVHQAVALNIIPKGTQVWGINKTNTKLISSNPAWKEIYGYAKNELIKLIARHQIGTMMAEKAQLSGANSRTYGSAGEWYQVLGHLTNIVGVYVREWHRVSKANTAAVDVDSLRRLAVAVGVDVNSAANSSAPVVNLEAMWEQIMREYPLLKHSTRMHPTHDAFAEFVHYINLVDASNK
jgi:PAS domain-containing protein